MHEDYEFYTYIMASESGVLYTGMTNNLIRRVQEHKDGTIEWFTKKYKCHKLVYFEFTRYIYNAIAREKEIKHFPRKEKISLIESMNLSWKDLYPELID